MNSILRKKTLIERGQLSREDFLSFSDKIHLAVERELFKSKVNFFIYLSINKEVDTFLLIRKLFKANKNIFVPWTSVEEKKIIPVRISETNFRHDLVPGFHDILQPDDKLLARGYDCGGTIDVAICPGSLFDIRGARVGYGGGYYDRLLCREEFKKVLKVGICFDFQLVGKLEQQDHDVPMDCIITENRIVYRPVG